MTNIFEKGDVRSALKFFDAWIECQMVKEQKPALSMAVVRDQEILWRKAYGFADLEKKIPATVDTIFRIASISKLFTATALMILRDEGKLRLDDPAEDYLPWFRIKNPFPGSPKVTIRSLITHTSGLPRESPFPYWNDAKFPTREEMIDALRRQELIYPPGTTWKYSNLGVAIAGEVVAAASGVDYAKFVHERILEPLGMTSTSVQISGDLLKRLATGYSRRGLEGGRKKSPFTDSRGITPAANIATTSGDLARFMSLQFREDSAPGESQILSGYTLKEMHRIQWLQDWEGGRGLGFGVRKLGNLALCGHGGAVEGHRSQISFCPDEKFGALCLINADEGDPGRFVDNAFRIILPAVKNEESGGAEVRQAPELWKTLEGKYSSCWSETQIMIYAGELVMFDPTSPDPQNGVLKLEPTEEKYVFRLGEAEGHYSIGEKVVFNVSDEGEVKKITCGATETYPIDDWYEVLK